MAERGPVEVTVEIGGRAARPRARSGSTIAAGRRHHSGTPDSYLASPDGYALDPALPKSGGVFHTPPGSTMFNAFADSAPDRWGENLMRREERERARAAAATPRTLGKADFLLGVRDDTREGRHPVPATARWQLLLRTPERGSAADRGRPAAARLGATGRR